MSQTVKKWKERKAKAPERKKEYIRKQNVWQKNQRKVEKEKMLEATKGTKFQHGDMAWISKTAGLSKQYVTNCLTGRRVMRQNYAEKLVEVAGGIGYVTSVFDWLFPKESLNPLFAKWSLAAAKKEDILE